MDLSPGLLGAFVWPGLFYGGAAAMSLPILIHLLARRRFKRIRWAAVDFLLQAERRNRRRIRLEDLILMLMRCLVVLLIGLLVARPFVRPEGLAALLGGSDRTERIFVLDDSFSMGYQSGEDTSFSRCKRAVVQLIGLLREQSPHDTVTVLRTSTMDTPVAIGVFLDPKQTEELFARIEGLSVSQCGMSSRDIMLSVRKILDEQSETVSAAVYLISDFQRKDWVDTAREVGEDAEPSPIAPLAGWKGESRGLKLILVDVGDDDAQNVAVTAVNAARSRFVAGVGDSITATMANFSASATSPLDLEVTVGASTQPTVTVGVLQAGDITRVPLRVTAVHPGWESIRVGTPGDALAVDDQRTLVIEAVEAVRTLVVNGEPSSDVFRDEVALLRTALRPPGEVFSGNEVEVIDETELEDTDLTLYDVVILANVYRVSERAAEVLSSFTFAGGGVAVFLGDQVDPDSYNEILYAAGDGLLPAALGESRRAGTPTTGARLRADQPLHPMVRVLAGAENPFVKQITFRQYFSSTPATVDAVNAPGDMNVAGRGDAEVVAHFDDGDATPAIIERRFGLGRVTLFTSTCDPEWNDWPKDASFVVAMLELAQHLARGRGATADLLVGSPVEFAIDLGRYMDHVRVRTPKYPAEQEVSITAVPAADGRGFVVRWDQTHTSGVYRFILTNQTGEEEVRAIAVNLDPGESDLNAAVEADLKQSLHELPFTYFAGLESLDRIGEEARRELWKTILLAAVVILFGEQFLAWWFSRRS